MDAKWMSCACYVAVKWIGSGCTMHAKCMCRVLSAFDVLSLPIPSITICRFFSPHAITLSHPGVRCRCLAAHGDPVGAVKW